MTRTPESNKHQTYRPQGKQVGQKRDDGNRPKIQGHQRRGEYHRPQSSGQYAHHKEHGLVQQPHGGKALPLLQFIVGEYPPLDRVGAAEDPRHRQKRQLKPYVGRGKGVLYQNQQQGKAQSRGAVPLPVEQGRNLQQQDHYRGPHHRRGAARHSHKQKDQGNQHQSSAPPASAKQQRQRPRQKGHMHTGHSHRMGQSRALEG